MNIETCISIVAAFFYSLFVEKLKTVDPGSPLPYDDLVTIRYNDWVITTPLMLLVLCMVLGNENKKPLHFWVFLIVILLDLGMLIFGYLGEMKKMDKKAALVIGFAFFFAMYGFIWYYFLHGAKNGFAVQLIFNIFVVVWSLYGVIYLVDDDTRNTMYNMLDVFAKCFVGIFLWLYFTNVVVF
jgi:bacteriorhodopsin